MLISLAIPYAEQMMSLPFLPSTAYQSLMVHHFIYVDGSIIGQPYLTEPMGEPGAWAVLYAGSLLSLRFSSLQRKNSRFYEKRGEWR